MNAVPTAPPELSIRRVLWRDWPSRGLTIFAVLWWLIVAGAVLATLWVPKEDFDRSFPVTLAIIGLLISLPIGVVVVWRIWNIRRVFASGEFVTGRVVFKGQNSEDVGYALLAYTHDGQEYRVKNVVEGASAESDINQGDSVELVVDPRKPSRAYIRKLFLD
jgi:hypothetical protein